MGARITPDGHRSADASDGCDEHSPRQGDQGPMMQASRRQPSSPSAGTATRTARRWLFRGALAVCLVAAAYQLALNHLDGVYVHRVAQQVVAKAGAVTPRQKVLALRDYPRG